MRWRNSFVRAGAWSCLMSCLPACALGEGDPWGELAVAVRVRFAPPADRVHDGLLGTARDYRLQLDELVVTIATVAISSGEDAIAFDPANPPPGYSFCHNGHCHSDDGRLVPYEEIGDSGGGETLVALSGESVVVDGLSHVQLTGCGPPCEVLAPAQINALSVSVGLRATGRAFDSRVAARLPEDGVAFDLDLPLRDLLVPMAARFGPGQQLGLAIDVVLDVPASLFDDVDFVDPDAAAASARLDEDATLILDLSRFD
jgi:hypothetical protein